MKYVLNLNFSTHTRLVWEDYIHSLNQELCVSVCDFEIYLLEPLTHVMAKVLKQVVYLP